MSCPQVFVSSAASKGSTCKEVVSSLLAGGIRNIELTAGLEKPEDALSYLYEAHSTGASFLVHNYFPQPSVPFVLNLASDDENTLQRSLDHCKRAIQICSNLTAPFYSVHSGFCFHAEPHHLGKNQSQLRAIPRRKAEEIFCTSLRELVQFGSALGVRIAIENNVVTQKNAEQGSERYLGVHAGELLRLCDETGVTILLDVAHAKVSARTLGFSPIDYINEVASKVEAVHLSDNNGEGDTNDPITHNSWFWGPLQTCRLTAIPWVVEVYNQTTDQIHSQLQIINEKFGERYEECPL
jgi:sugar phosphate isomerase/epimerase